MLICRLHLKSDHVNKFCPQVIAPCPKGFLQNPPHCIILDSFDSLCQSCSTCVPTVIKMGKDKQLLEHLPNIVR